MSSYIQNWHLIKKLLYRLIYRNQKIIAVSEGIKSDFLNVLSYQPEEILTIYNPFDINKIQGLSKGSIQHSNFVLYVGSINIIKRIDLLIKAYIESNIPQDLILLGFGEVETDYEKEIKNFIRYSGSDKKIKCLPFLKNPYQYIKNAELLILSSDHEGLPSVLIEALILKTKIVSTNCSYGISEIFTGNLFKYVSITGNYSKLSQNIIKAINENILISKKHYQKFDSEKIFLDFKDLIDD
jgi:glycosyltransferase involved in cell wall biosynthesis